VHLGERLEGAVPSSIRWIFPLLLLLLVNVTSLGQNTTTASELSFTIAGSQVWTDTGTDLNAGDSVFLTAEAKPGSENCGSAGATSTASEKLPLNDAPAGALIARTEENAQPTFVGNGHEFQMKEPGHLFLGINQAGKSDCAFVVKAKINRAQTSAAQTGQRNMKDQLSSAAKVWIQGQFGKSSQANSTEASNAVTSNATTGTAPASSSGLKVPTVILDAELRKYIDDLPRRVHDHLGNPGDMVNFVIVGSQERAQAALDAADWHLADVDSKEAGLKAIMNTYQKKDYLEMPMSHLYLFDRMQDFGYEQAQAFSVVASRHHFRMWKTPFTWNGETVFVGAATHDVGFEKDVRSGHLTHKIDPDVDLERENIAQGLQKSGKIKNMTYYLPANPVQDAKNASGGGYHSDGRLLVVFLQ
jgi:hypothetical protein